MANEAKVNINIKTFRKVATTTEPTRYCAVEVAMPAEHPKVGLIQPNSSKKNGKFVFSGLATLQVRLIAANGTDAVFIPLSAAFRRSWNCALDSKCNPMGKGIFNTTRVLVPADPATGEPEYWALNIENLFNTVNVRYEFYILVQREEDAALGLIDPDIENQQ